VYNDPLLTKDPTTGKAIRTPSINVHGDFGKGWDAPHTAVHETLAKRMG